MKLLDAAWTWAFPVPINEGAQLIASAPAG